MLYVNLIYIFIIEKYFNLCFDAEGNKIIRFWSYADLCCFQGVQLKSSAFVS